MASPKSDLFERMEKVKERSKMSLWMERWRMESPGLDAGLLMALDGSAPKRDENSLYFMHPLGMHRHPVSSRHGANCMPTRGER